MDLFSTVAATSYLGSFEYERNGLLRAVYDVAGYLGVIVAKIVVGAGVLIVAYLCGRYWPGCEAWARGVLTGSILTGAFISISNTKILFTNSSIWIMNIDAATVSICIMVGTTLIITAYELFFKNYDKEISKTVFQN
jgi:hypothetical protein